MNNDNFLWVERYRPLTVEDCILPDNIKSTFLEFSKKGEFLNMVLSGPPGIGKTSIAKAMLNDIGADYIVINGSLSGGIDTLRTEIQDYASTVGFSDGRKYVILDEADGISPKTQRALRSFMEDYSSNCGFILTCNFKNKIIDAIVDSRCVEIDFKIKKKDIPELARQFFKRASQILTTEEIPFDKKVLIGLIAKNCPDWRKTLNELQKYATTYGKIDEAILVNFSDSRIGDLVSSLKAKDFGKARKWIGENSDMDMDVLFKKIYDSSYELVDPSSIPDLILILAKYQYQNAFVANPEINLAAAVLEIMGSCSFR